MISGIFNSNPYEQHINGWYDRQANRIDSGAPNAKLYTEMPQNK